MIPEQIDHQFIGGLLELVDNGIVEGILVLVQPVGQVVVDDAGVVSDGEVGVLILSGLQEKSIMQKRLESRD